MSANFASMLNYNMHRLSKVSVTLILQAPLCMNACQSLWAMSILFSMALIRFKGVHIAPDVVLTMSNRLERCAEYPAPLSASCLITTTQHKQNPHKRRIRRY